MFNQNSSTNTKNNEAGKFYLIFDCSRTGHSRLAVWKDDIKLINEISERNPEYSRSFKNKNNR